MVRVQSLSARELGDAPGTAARPIAHRRAAVVRGAANARDSGPLGPLPALLHGADAGLVLAVNRVHPNRPIRAQPARGSASGFYAGALRTLVLAAPAEGAGDEVGGVGKDPRFVGVEARDTHAAHLA